jgi:PIN domain nuclease of toxin-antitoxin system
MRLLLDTHILLWALTKDDRLGATARMILDSHNDVMVSTVSYLELAIKASQGKIDVDVVELRKAVARSGFEEVSIQGKHAEILGQLPWYHKDPFDRILVAQALAEPMRLLTVDPQVARYSDTVLLVSKS